jgi:hypothetical protein
MLDRPIFPPGLELTQIYPILDNRSAPAKFAVELVASALGKRIL